MKNFIFILALLLCATAAQAEVKIERSIHYGKDAKQIVDVYQPDACKKENARCPVVMWVHGGGWRHGDTSGEKSTAMQSLWAAQGIVMVGVNYRLSPQVKHPAHVEDVAAAINWTARNIAGYGGDPARISLLGHSAGAHLVALVATNPRFLGHYDLEPCKALKYVFPIDTASFDLSNPSRFVGRMITQAFGDDPETLADASPVKQVRPDGCYPAFVIAATKARADAVATSKELARLLQEAGTTAPVMIRDYPGKGQLKAHGAIALELADPESTMTKTLWENVLR